MTTPDPLVPLEQFAHRLERRTSYEEATQELIDALDDLFGFRYAVLIAPEDVEAGTGLIGTAASRRRVVATANLDRARAMAGSSPLRLPGPAGARSAAAMAARGAPTAAEPRTSRSGCPRAATTSRRACSCSVGAWPRSIAVSRSSGSAGGASSSGSSGPSS
jgi:hypothetical protein